MYIFLFIYIVDMSDTTTWLELDEGIKVEIYLCHGFIHDSPATGNKKGVLSNIIKKRR